MLDLTSAVVVYLTLLGLMLLGLWFYYDRREHARFEVDRRKATFHCIRCGQLYAAKTGTETAACPRCGHTNTRLKF